MSFLRRLHRGRDRLRGERGDDPESVLVFYRGTDTLLWRTWSHQAGKWSHRCCQGPPISGFGPAAVQWGADRIAVFQQGKDGVLLQRCWDAAPPGEPLTGEVREVIEGPLGSSPAVTTWGSVRQHAAVVYADNKGELRCRWWRDERWSQAEDIGVGCVEPYTSPTVVSWDEDRVAVFFLQRLSPAEFPQLHWCSWTKQQGWGPKRTVLEAGHLTRVPEAAAWAPGELALFYWRAGIGLERQGLFWRPWSHPSGWGKEQGPLPGYLDSRPAVACLEGKYAAVFYVGTSRELYFSEWDPRHGWSEEQAVGGRATSDPTALVVAPILPGFSQQPDSA